MKINERVDPDSDGHFRIVVIMICCIVRCFRQSFHYLLWSYTPLTFISCILNPLHELLLDLIVLITVCRLELSWTYFEYCGMFYIFLSHFFVFF